VWATWKFVTVPVVLTLHFRDRPGGSRQKLMDDGWPGIPDIEFYGSPCGVGLLSAASGRRTRSVELFDWPTSPSAAASNHLSIVWSEIALGRHSYHVTAKRS
jgi:hypothetical protein